MDRGKHHSYSLWWKGNSNVGVVILMFTVAHLVLCLSSVASILIRNCRVYLGLNNYLRSDGYLRKYANQSLLIVTTCDLQLFKNLIKLFSHQYDYRLGFVTDNHQAQSNYIKLKKFQTINISDKGLVRKFRASTNFNAVMIFIFRMKLKILKISEKNNPNIQTFDQQKYEMWRAVWRSVKVSL